MRKPSSFVKLASEANKTPKTKSFDRLLRKYRIEKAILNMNKEHIKTFMEPFEGCLIKTAAPMKNKRNLNLDCNSRILEDR
jgi:hypothetical protein